MMKNNTTMFVICVGQVENTIINFNIIILITFIICNNEERICTEMYLVFV